jgi:phosphoglycolate phosphatase-like HAD superfamily hydrolase
VPETSPLVFDFDGVVLRSVDIKTRSFATLFEAEGPAVVARVVEHHLANGGLSRFEKFRWIYREVLERPLSVDEEKRLGDAFNALVEDAVMKADWVPGAREFLESNFETRPFYVASGTPEPELRRIVEKRGMTKYFRGVFGSPKRKDVILKEIAAAAGCPAAALTMIGDARNDYDAAKAAGCRFVGVAASSGSFPKGTLVLPDLTTLKAALAAAKAAA